jgi:hypothetical protein
LFAVSSSYTFNSSNPHWDVRVISRSLLILVSMPRFHGGCELLWLAALSLFRRGSCFRPYIYSDGVGEAQNQKGELFGFDRAKGLSTQTAASIVDAAVQFGQSDDITVIVIGRAAAIATAA